MGSNPTAARTTFLEDSCGCHSRAKSFPWPHSMVFVKNLRGQCCLYFWRVEEQKKKRGSVAEWSKALDLGSSLSGGVGSNPTAASSGFNQGREALRVLEKSLKILWEHFSLAVLANNMPRTFPQPDRLFAKAGWLSPAPGAPSFLCGLLTTCIVADDLSQSCVDLFFQTHRRLVVTATQPQALTRLGLDLFYASRIRLQLF